MTTLASAAADLPPPAGHERGQARRLVVDSACLVFSVCGPAGAPWVTLLHSLATDSRLWAAQREILARDHQVLSIDLRGHGLSLCDDRPVLISDLAKDVVAVWAELGITRSSIVGLSIGGMTALCLGLDYPDLIDRIVAADCRTDAPPFFRDLWIQRRAVVQGGGIAAITPATLASWLTPDSRLSRPDLVRAVTDMIDTTSVAGYRAATHALMNLDEKPRLPGMTRPVLFLCGAEDGVHPDEMRAMAALTPGAEYLEIPAASHLSNLEQPEAFNAALIGWLS